MFVVRLVVGLEHHDAPGTGWVEQEKPPNRYVWRGDLRGWVSGDTEEDRGCRRIDGAPVDQAGERLVACCSPVIDDHTRCVNRGRKLGYFTG
jgi:hypothetical protein